MLVVNFFRWIYGFFYFELSGKFPERFLNLCAKRGIILWKTDGKKESLSACAKLSEKNTIAELAVKTNCKLDIIKEHGLPAFCQKYKYRIGLLLGAVTGTILCTILSGYIWNININAPSEINEFEIRKELTENGLYEGIPYNYEYISSVERRMKLSDERISWISINVFGTNAVVEISPKNDSEKRKTQKSKTEKPVSNLISTSDGTITRIEVQNGSAAVKPGDGVRKGQLLVSGVMEYSDGSNDFADSGGKVFAKTSRKIIFEIPQKINMPVSEYDAGCIKRDIDFFGIKIPLSFLGNPDGLFYKKNKIYRMTLLGNDLPIKIQEERLYSYQTKDIFLTDTEAKKILTNRFKIFKLFMSSDPDTTILKENISFEKSSDKFILTAEVTAEENICEKNYIKVNITE